MQLDVIIPTYNREELLRRTLDSLSSAEAPRGLDVRVTVVDNNSRDNTRGVVESRMNSLRYPLNYLFEERQGRSHALNAGIEGTSGDLIGMIDDDEEIDAQWYSQILQAFSDGDLDFIGGPYVPRWGANKPDWLPLEYRGAIGWVDGGSRPHPFNDQFPGILMGGNAVLTRKTIERVGLYSTNLGRTDKHLLSCEDEEMYSRLLAAGARGVYMPGLIIYHYVPPERLTKQYFRRWCFWRGVSLGVINRQKRAPVAYLAGVPRWLIGKAARGMGGIASGIVARRSDPAGIFSKELALWDLAGFFYGSHFYRPAH